MILSLTMRIGQMTFTLNCIDSGFKKEKLKNVFSEYGQTATTLFDLELLELEHNFLSKTVQV